ncbi:MAG: porin, partial [Mangrovicoccus sp.]
MKKILLASSALVLVGGAAFAEVTLKGSAEFGIFGGSYNDLPLPDGSGDIVSEDIPAQFHTDMDVDFILSGETDGGVTFGADIDLDEVANGIPSASGVKALVFVSGDFGTISGGDTDGAFDWALTENNFGLSGSIIDNEEHIGFSGQDILDGFYDGQVVRYDYSFGAFAFGLSAEIDDDRGNDGAADTDDPVYGVGAKYTLDLASGSVKFGAGWQGVEDAYLAGISAAATFGDLSASVSYFDGEVYNLALGVNDEGTNIALSSSGEGDLSSDNLVDITYTGLSVGYTFDAITVGANYGTYDIPGYDDIYGYGVTAGYDLGGSLSLL